jgi:hypothetical protein
MACGGCSGYEQSNIAWGKLPADGAEVALEAGTTTRMCAVWVDSCSQGGGVRVLCPQVVVMYSRPRACLSRAAGITGAWYCCDVLFVTPRQERLSSVSFNRSHWPCVRSIQGCAVGLAVVNHARDIPLGRTCVKTVYFVDIDRVWGELMAGDI